MVAAAASLMEVQIASKIPTVDFRQTDGQRCPRSGAVRAAGTADPRAEAGPGARAREAGEHSFRHAGAHGQRDDQARRYRPQQLCVRRGGSVARPNLQGRRCHCLPGRLAGLPDRQQRRRIGGIRPGERTGEGLEWHQLAMELCFQAGHGEDVAAGSADGNVRHLGNDRVFRDAGMRPADAKGLSLRSPARPDRSDQSPRNLRGLPGVMWSASAAARIDANGYWIRSVSTNASTIAPKTSSSSSRPRSPTGSMSTPMESAVL